MTAPLATLLAGALARSAHAIRSVDGDDLGPSELARGAERLAQALGRAGLRLDEPVLVTIRNRPEDLGALLAVWSAGGVAVPIHAGAAGTTRAAVWQATGARLSVPGAEVVVLDAPPPPERPLLQGAALIVFTSGSTGRPKGVVIGHAGLLGKLEVLSRLVPIGTSDMVVVPLQLTFIFGLWASLLTLDAGASLMLVPRFSPEAIAKALGEGGSVLAAVPSMLRALCAGGSAEAPSLRCVLTGGEALGSALTGRIGSLYPAAGLYDLYGLTETGSCDFALLPADQPHGTGSIGRPTAGVEFRLLGPDGGTAGPGEAAELQVRTPFAMLGYLDDPALTAGSYTDGYFRTGDLARLRPDGRVELVGRSKEMISRGGNKIGPLEVDDLLASHPHVAAALCAGIPDERLGEAILAMVVLKPGLALTGEELRAWAATKTERFKVPDRIVFCDALPVGDTGKASRAAVRERSSLADPRGGP